MPHSPARRADIIVLPPAVGAAPLPPEAIMPALDLLDVLQAAPRRLGDQIAASLSSAWRVVAARLQDHPYRPQAHGLSRGETERWARQARTLLAPGAWAALHDYAAACRTWERRLHAIIGDDAADPDWDMTSARHVAPSVPEAYLAHTLAGIGVPVQAQVGVSRTGGARRGGWFAAFWLDCAHRDVAHLLRIDIELDGSYHRYRKRQASDQVRNQILQARGWYVVRLRAHALGTQAHDDMLEQVLRIVEEHRRAIVLARSEQQVLARVRALDAEDGQGAVSRSPDDAPSLPTPAPEQDAASGRDATTAVVASRRCPRCGDALVLRRARKGPQAGESFWGCATFPRCRYTQAA